MKNVNGTCPECRHPATLVFGPRDAAEGARPIAHLLAIACRNPECRRFADPALVG